MSLAVPVPDFKAHSSFVRIDSRRRQASPYPLGGPVDFKALARRAVSEAGVREGDLRKDIGNSKVTLPHPSALRRFSTAMFINTNILGGDRQVWSSEVRSDFALPGLRWAFRQKPEAALAFDAISREVRAIDDEDG